MSDDPKMGFSTMGFSAFENSTAVCLRIRSPFGAAPKIGYDCRIRSSTRRCGMPSTCCGCYCCSLRSAPPPFFFAPAAVLPWSLFLPPRFKMHQQLWLLSDGLKQACLMVVAANSSLPHTHIPQARGRPIRTICLRERLCLSC